MKARKNLLRYSEIEPEVFLKLPNDKSRFN